MSYYDRLTDLQNRAAQGSAEAFYDLAIKYEHSIHVDQDFNKAIEYLDSSIKLGYAPAKFRMALYHYYGIGTQQSTVKALEWIEEALRSLKDSVFSRLLSFKFEVQREISSLEKTPEQSHQEFLNQKAQGEAFLRKLNSLHTSYIRQRAGINATEESPALEEALN